MVEMILYLTPPFEPGRHGAVAVIRGTGVAIGRLTGSRFFAGLTSLKIRSLRAHTQMWNLIDERERAAGAGAS